MSAPVNNFKLGLFTLCGLAILIAGVLAFGLRGYLQPTSLFETYIAGDVTGLNVGSQVQLRGVSVGKVTRIDFSWNEYGETQPSYVIVEFELRNDVTPLPPGKARSAIIQSAIDRGLRARLKSQGITGTSFLSLEYVNPGDNPVTKVPWTPRHTYIPAAPGEFVELLASIEKTLRNLESLDFAGIGQSLQGDLTSAGKVINRVNQVDFGGLGANANSLLTELRASNSSLKAFIADTDDTERKMKLEKLSQNADELIAQLQQTVTTLQPGLANVDFDALNQALENAQRSMRDLDDVLLQLKQYPSGFLFGRRPAPIKVTQPLPRQ